jgi:hydrogenase expression/formation protein HypC
MATVDFGGVTREVCTEVVPDAKPGDWTIVHAGFALNLLSEEEARETLDILQEMAELADQEDRDRAG